MTLNLFKSVVLGLFLLSGLLATAQYQPPEFPALLETIDHPVFKSGNYKATRVFTDDHNGVSHAYGYQTYEGIEIEGAKFGAHAKEGAVVYHNERFISLQSVASPQSHQLRPSEVLVLFMGQQEAHLSGIELPRNSEWKATDIHEFELKDESLSEETIRIKRTYFVENGNLLPSWSMSYLLPDGSHWYYSIFNAVDGALMDQYDWNLNCSATHYHSGESHAESSNHPGEGFTSRKKGDGSSYRVFAQPIESPNHGSQSLEKDPSNGKASPFGWHDVDGLNGHEYEITRGNNVWASEDRNAFNSPGYSPSGGSKLEFDFDYTDGADPLDNTDAAIVNLFYWNNVIHDVIYHYGFNEESGNFQENNYGKAPFGDFDAVMADAMDGSGTNNANFATPPDGINPRMQMFLWETPRQLGVDVLSPSVNAGSYSGFQASFGPQLTKKPLKAELVMSNDATAAPTLACSSLANSSAINGKIALIERGTCTFATKIRNAQNAGAIAVLMFTDNRSPVVMGGDGTEGDITIPAILIDRARGLLLMDELKSGSITVQLYDSSKVQQPKDSDFDNGIITHEYGHGISTRLTGGADDVNCLRNQEQMGEGWSDFFGLVLTHKSGDKPTDLRGVGTFVRGESTSGGGIRPYPYSTDTTVSQYTYDDIASLSVPHGVGSVWCSMLWDLYWALINEYGYDEDLIGGTGGNNICMQLVVDGLKIQPCGPGFVDGRDAIIAADKLNNEGKNEKLIWESFSRRGLGFGARQGDPDDLNDGVMKYDIPPKFKFDLVVSKTAPEKIEEDAVLSYDILIDNQSSESYVNISVIDTLPAELAFDMDSDNCDWDVNGQVLTMTIDELKPGEKLECSYNTRLNAGDYGKFYIENGAEEVDKFWTTVSDEGTNAWYRQIAVKGEGNYAWYVKDQLGVSDQSLMYDLGKIEDGAILSFQHLYNTRTSRHGGVVEFSENGTDWTDAENDFIQNGYNDAVGSIPDHLLMNRRLFGGFSQGFITSEIDLSPYIGKNIKVRFRYVTHLTSGVEGWYIDDLKLFRTSAITNDLWVTASSLTAKSSATTVVFEKGEGDAIEQVPQTSITSIYPNPASNFVMVLANDEMQDAVVTLSDLNGRELYRRQFIGSQIEIGTKALSSGCYIISVSANGTTERHRLIKK